jgi:phospholipid/cholesterol/gamma-HCH transport system substrate-binding protein
MATPRQKVQVGIFLMVCGLLLVATLVILSGWQREKTIPYFIEFNESVSGLFAGADVRYRGVPVGRVTDIAVMPTNRIRVQVEIRPSVIRIRRGMTAQLSTTGITGQLYINLTGGDPDAPLLEYGDTIPATPSLFANLSAELPALLASINSVLVRLDKTLGEKGRVVTVIEEAETLLTELKVTVIEVRSRTLSLLDHANIMMENEVGPLMTELRTSAQITGRVLKRIGPPLQEAFISGAKTLEQLETHLAALDLQGTNANVQLALQRVTQMAERFTQTSEELNLTLQHLRSNTTNTEFYIKQAVRSLRETLQSAKQLFDYLEQNPSALLRGKGTPVHTRDGHQR